LKKNWNNIIEEQRAKGRKEGDKWSRKVEELDKRTYKKNDVNLLEYKKEIKKKLESFVGRIPSRFKFFLKKCYLFIITKFQEYYSLNNIYNINIDLKSLKNIYNIYENLKSGKIF